MKDEKVYMKQMLNIRKENMIQKLILQIIK